MLFEQTSENGQKILNHIADISYEEVEDIQSYFHFAVPYTTSVMMEDVVLRNSSLLVQHMDPARLNQFAKHRNDAIAIANQFVLNYATSLKTFLDICERHLKKDCTETQQEIFKRSQSTFYDTCVEYRFWMRLRNFVVHCGFPYTQLIHNENGMQVLCCKEHLLTFSNWNMVKKDIEEMEEYIDLVTMVPKMDTCIASLRLVFVGQYAESISKASKAYSAFCSKYSAESLVIGSAESVEAFKKGQCSLHPLPLDQLVNAMVDLKQVV